MVDYSIRDEVAVLLLNNPPVNALSYAVRQGLQDGLTRASSDGNVKAIVIAGQGKAFSAGADIKEFSGLASREPNLIDLCNSIESCSKPVVAAIHGTAYGGGLEIAISCHYRIALKSAKVSFPEVMLGILPGAGGTQRLPRLTGLKVAIDMITSGRTVKADKALQYGILEQVVPQNIEIEGIKLAKSKFGQSVKRTSFMPIKDASQAEQIIEDAMKKANKVSGGMLAPIYCIQAVAASVKCKTFEEGLKKEFDLFRVLMTSGQAKALQYVFFAQRVATKWQLPNGVNAGNTRPQPVKTGAVIGAGTMGTGIAMVLLNAGIPVILLEQDQKFLDKGVQTIQGLYDGSVMLGRMTQEQANWCMSMLKPSLSYNDLSDVDCVIEAVFENMEIKKDVFSKLDKVCKPNALLCSNTSTLDIDEIASATSRPEKVVGTHFFAPAYYMKLLENIRGAHSSPETIASVMTLGQRIGKIPVLVGNCNGFCGNRMMGPYVNNAIFCVEDGALPHEVDRVIEEFGIPIGPFKVNDMSGLDIGYRIRQALFKDAERNHPLLRYGFRFTPLSDQLVEMGRLGRKTGNGWYSYGKPGGKKATVDDSVTAMILDHCKNNNIVRRTIRYQEILERCLYGLINEGFNVLDDGIVSRPEEIDIIWITGYGWPRQTGGPMFYANQVGLTTIYEKVCYYNAQDPLNPYWKPSRLLQKLSRNKLPMDEWTKMANSRL